MIGQKWVKNRPEIVDKKCNKNVPKRIQNIVPKPRLKKDQKLEKNVLEVGQKEIKCAQIHF